MYFVSVVMVGRGGVAREETNVVILLLIGGGGLCRYSSAHSTISYQIKHESTSIIHELPQVDHNNVNLGTTNHLTWQGCWGQRLGERG